MFGYNMQMCDLFIASLLFWSQHKNGPQCKSSWQPLILKGKLKLEHDRWLFQL